MIVTLIGVRRNRSFCPPVDAEAAVRMRRPRPTVRFGEKRPQAPERFGRMRNVSLSGGSGDPPVCPAEIRPFRTMDRVLSIRSDHSPLLSATAGTGSKKRRVEARDMASIPKAVPIDGGKTVGGGGYFSVPDRGGVAWYPRYSVPAGALCDAVAWYPRYSVPAGALCAAVAWYPRYSVPAGALCVAVTWYPRYSVPAGALCDAVAWYPRYSVPAGALCDAAAWYPRYSFSSRTLLMQADQLKVTYKQHGHVRHIIDS